MSTTDWSRFDTPVHREAQAKCNHLFHCAVDAATRKRVWEDIEYARKVSDMNAFQTLMAQLSGPCVLPAGEASDEAR